VKFGAFRRKRICPSRDREPLAVDDEGRVQTADDVSFRSLTFVSSRGEIGVVRFVRESRGPTSTDKG